jgi:hypothetical protein
MSAIYAIASAENSPGNLPVDMVVGYPTLTCALYRSYYATSLSLYEQYNEGEIDFDEYLDEIVQQGEIVGFFPGWGGLIQFSDEPSTQSTYEDVSLLSFSETVPAPDGEGSLGDYDTRLSMYPSDDAELSITGLNGLQGSFVDVMTLVDQATEQTIGEYDVTISFDVPLCDLD